MGGREGGREVQFLKKSVAPAKLYGHSFLIHLLRKANLTVTQEIVRLEKTLKGLGKSGENFEGFEKFANYLSDLNPVMIAATGINAARVATPPQPRFKEREAVTRAAGALSSGTSQTEPLGWTLPPRGAGATVPANSGRGRGAEGGMSHSARETLPGPASPHVSR